MSDSKYWQSQSTAMLRQYRTLQGFADVARHEGTADLALRVRTALEAVWALVEETDRLTNREARHASVVIEGLRSCRHEWEERDGYDVDRDYRCRLCGAWTSMEQMDRDFEQAAANGEPDPVIVDPFDAVAQVECCRHGISVDDYCAVCEAKCREAAYLGGMTDAGLEAEADYYDQVQQERDGAYALADAVLSGCGEADEEPPLCYQYEAQEPDTAALRAERIAFAAMLSARQADADAVRELRAGLDDQAGRWLPSASGVITRLPVTSALDSLFS